jgi:hypothetical protein
MTPPQLYPPPSHHTAASWDARIANIAAHKENLTHVSPCIHALEADGSFGVQTGGGEQGSYADIAPHIPSLQAMGCDSRFLPEGTSHAGALDANMQMTNDIPLPLTVTTVHSVQT